MSYHQFRTYHILSAIDQFRRETAPLDLFLGSYFRRHTAIGSKDRLFISDTIYQYIRWKNLFDYMGIQPNDALSYNPLSYLKEQNIPLHIRYGIPFALYGLLSSAYSPSAVEEICLISNKRAPTTLRINPMKISREALFRRWKKALWKVSPCQFSHLGFHIDQKINISSLPEFKAGYFEIQDEASQLAALLVKAKPKEQVLDYCAGAGGKTLAYASLLDNKGQIYLHDIRSSALAKARKRLKRAGIYNVQYSLPINQKKKIDWVVVDVPCSGTGTFRRNPDLKWKEMQIEKIVLQQREIVGKAIDYLHPDGTLVYITCSILPQENEEQELYFTKKYNLKVINRFQTIPIENGMDGFFAIAMKKETI